jgi:hypothetical protein
MGILTPLIERATLALFDPRQYLPLGRAVALELIRDAPPWHVLQALEQLAKELRGRLLIALALDQDIEDVVVLIHGPPQVMPLTMDCQEDLVQRPCIARLWTPPS